MSHIQEMPSVIQDSAGAGGADPPAPELARETSLVAGKPRVAEEDLPPATRQFLKFAETHRTVLNQILRQSTAHLADGPFAVLVSSPNSPIVPTVLYCHSLIVLYSQLLAKTLTASSFDLLVTTVLPG